MTAPRFDSPHTRWVPGLGLGAAALALLLGASACGENSFDIYMRGLAEIENAEKRHCVMERSASGSMVISSGKIIECVEANKEALATIQLAKQKGQAGADIEETIRELETKIEKLEKRRSVVGYMEREREIEDRK